MELDDTRLAELFDGVAALRGPRTVTLLAGGLTNHNFRVEIGSASFVVRLSDPDTGLLAIDRDNEHVNSVAAAAAGVGADVIDYQPQNSMLVLEFLENTETMSREAMQRGDRLGDAAIRNRTMQRGHQARTRKDDET